FRCLVRWLRPESVMGQILQFSWDLLVKITSDARLIYCLQRSVKSTAKRKYYFPEHMRLTLTPKSTLRFVFQNPFHTILMRFPFQRNFAMVDHTRKPGIP